MGQQGSYQRGQRLVAAFRRKGRLRIEISIGQVIAESLLTALWEKYTWFEGKLSFGKGMLAGKKGVS